MNSGISPSVLQVESHLHTPRLISITTVVYVLLLLAVGTMMCMLPGGGIENIFFALPTAFLPAMIYLIGTFLYGGTLFGTEDGSVRERCWRRLIWITATLYATTLVASSIGEFVALRRDASFESPAWYVFIVFIFTMIPVALWAYIAIHAVHREPSIVIDAAARSSVKIGVALVAGGALMLSSLALDVGYESPGWLMFTSRGRWVSTEFIQIWSWEPWLNGLLLGGYAAGMVLSLMAIAAGLMLLRRRSIAPGWLRTMLEICLAVFWMTMTNYYTTCFSLVFIGIFNLEKKTLQFVPITMAWLLMFAVGMFLWFRYRDRRDASGRIARSVLLLWALPLMPMAVVMFWNAAAWGIFGLILYVAGLSMVTACCWKMSATGENALPVG